jgi:hypothetical protein
MHVITELHLLMEFPIDVILLYAVSAQKYMLFWEMLKHSKSGVRIELALLGAEILTFKVFALKS